MKSYCRYVYMKSSNYKLLADEIQKACSGAMRENTKSSEADVLRLPGLSQPCVGSQQSRSCWVLPNGPSKSGSWILDFVSNIGQMGQRPFVWF